MIIKDNITTRRKDMRQPGKNKKYNLGDKKKALIYSLMYQLQIFLVASFRSYKSYNVQNI